MSQETDERCARILDHVSPSGRYWHEDQETHLSTPAPYSSSDYYTHMLENEVGRRDLIVKYLDYLSQIVAPDDYPFGYEGASYSGVWALMRATSEQKAQAFVMATFKLVRRKDAPTFGKG